MSDNRKAWTTDVFFQFSSVRSRDQYISKKTWNTPLE
jgi:hypothetical protein